jgi:hypothetical protein
MVGAPITAINEGRVFRAKSVNWKTHPYTPAECRGANVRFGSEVVIPLRAKNGHSARDARRCRTRPVGPRVRYFSKSLGWRSRTACILAYCMIRISWYIELSE